MPWDRKSDLNEKYFAFKVDKRLQRRVIMKGLKR